jgi:hypothetical protein
MCQALVHSTSLKQKNNTGHKSTDRPQHSDSGRLQYPTVTNRQFIQTKKSTKKLKISRVIQPIVDEDRT